MLNYFEMAASQIGTIFRVPRENPELVEAKLAAFTRQVPMMYALVVVNTTALAITFMVLRHICLPSISLLHSMQSV